MGLEPGYLVSKHVKLVRMLQQGGMGSVWVADHMALHTEVAVKFISGAFADDANMVARFTREATTAAKIKSPHVVQVHDHGITPEGMPFIVMELLEGEDLAARITREGRLPVADVAAIVGQMCRVLSRSHRLGIIHRDIKPGNIFLVDTDGDIFIKLLDFGIAKTENEKSELTATGIVVGTLVYMGPEQLLRAKQVDLRADLWSLGVVAYRALTGQLPFKEEDGLGALIRSLENGIFFPPSEHVSGLPPAVDAFFERIFQPKPADRFASANEMADAFFGALGLSRRSVVWSDGEDQGGDPKSMNFPASQRNRAVAAASAAKPITIDVEMDVEELAENPASDASATSASGKMRRPESEKRAAQKASANEVSTSSAEPQPNTLAGTASLPPPLPQQKSKTRWAVPAVGALIVLVGGGLFISRFLTPDSSEKPASSAPGGANAAEDSPPPSVAITGEPATLSSSAGSNSDTGPNVVVTPSMTNTAVEPETASPTSSGSAATEAPSAAASASASASPEASASAAPTVPGKIRPWKKPKKDYGF